MNIHIKDEREHSIKTVTFDQKTVEQFLIAQQINSQTVLVVREGVVLTGDIELRDDDTLEILSVISGG